METINLAKLKILHVGVDPEFISPVTFEGYKVEINTTDNPFSASQWITENGLPDGVLCEINLTGDNGFDFFDFWVDQFDAEKTVPFFILDDEKNQETLIKAQEKRINEVYIKPTPIETIISRILILKKNDSGTNVAGISRSISYTSYETPFFKRTFDIVSASIGLVLLSPLLLIFIIAIRLESKGKAFYTTKRVGSGYNVFDFYKLRSMYTNADKRLQELSHLNQYLKEVHPSTSEKHSLHEKQGWHQSQGEATVEAGTLKMNSENASVRFENDPRHTKIGHIIWKSGIDRWPQLINVLKGDMSFVGNRPLPVYEAELLTTSDWKKRLYAPAGMTGLWKIEVRRKYKAMSSEARKDLDNKYAEIAKKNYSFWDDMWIIFRTIPAIFQKKNV